MSQQVRSDPPPLSVIVPVYNGQKHLWDCLLSIGEQSHDDFEAIVVDDGSTDDSLTIAQRFANQDPRFTVIPTPNRGVSEARNTGLKAARGTYVTFVDADDWLDPYTYERMLAPLAEHPYDAVAGDVNIESARGGQSLEQTTVAGGAYDADRIAREIRPIMVSSDRLTRDWPFRIVTKVFRRAHLLEHNLWFVPGLQAAQDFAFSVAAMFVAESFYYAKGLYGYHYRWNPASRTRSRLETPWANFRGVDRALQNAVHNSPEFTAQLRLAELHGDLSATTYLYRNCRLRDSRELYRSLTENLAKANRDAAFVALNWSMMPTGKRVICELMRRRRYRLMHCLLLTRGISQRWRAKSLTNRAA